MGIIDRMTDFHIQVLTYKSIKNRNLVIGDVDGVAASRVYGLPVFSSPVDLAEPERIHDYWNPDSPRYVEKSTLTSVRLAHADLVAMGLLEPVMKIEEVRKGLEVERKKTAEVAGYDVSELGRFVLAHIGAQDTAGQIRT